MSVLDLAPSRRGHFRLESGHHTDRWLDLDGLFREPKRMRPHVVALASKLRRYDFDVVCGAMLGGAFLAQRVADELETEFWFTEQKDGYSLPGAFDPKGRRVAIVDDVMSAGSAMRGTSAAIIGGGGHVVVAAALVFLGSIGIEFFTQQQIPLEALEREPFNLWQASVCRLCSAGVPLDSIA
jgi:orotate phosphoribosyltransferase